MGGPLAVMGGRVISGAGAESRGRLQAWDVAALPGMASGAMMFGELEEGEGGDNEAPDGRASWTPLSKRRWKTWRASR